MPPPKANAAAAEAAQRADAANSAAQQTQAKLDTSLQNLDNYKLVTTQPVYFGLNRTTLAKDEQQKLDDAVQKLASMKMYIVEVEGFADHTGPSAYNRELSRKRADAVVHYLAVEKSIPLRSIRELGVGSDFPNADNKTRAARKENRRVDVKIYSLDVTGQARGESSMNTAPSRSRPAVISVLAGRLCLRRRKRLPHGLLRPTLSVGLPPDREREPRRAPPGFWPLPVRSSFSPAPAG